MIQANRAVYVYSAYATKIMLPDPKLMTNDWVRVISGLFYI